MPIVNHEKIRLLDGFVIEANDDGEMPPLQSVHKVHYACDICPVRKYCNDNNEFDCQVYGMFTGFYFSLDDALRDYVVA